GGRFPDELHGEVDRVTAEIVQQTAFTIVQPVARDLRPAHHVEDQRELDLHGPTERALSHERAEPPIGRPEAAIEVHHDAPIALSAVQRLELRSEQQGLLDERPEADDADAQLGGVGARGHEPSRTPSRCATKRGKSALWASGGRPPAFAAAPSTSAHPPGRCSPVRPESGAAWIVPRAGDRAVVAGYSPVHRRI